MTEFTVIRFVGKKGEAFHYLKLGPIGEVNPQEREFQGGDKITAQIQQTPGNPDCVDLTFEDGQFAIEVPREFFEIIDELDGR